MDEHTSQFLERLRDAGLVLADTLSDVLDNFPPSDDSKNAAAIARQLVRKKLLTPFQARNLLKGGMLTCGCYRLLDCIGTGGMGKVYKAEKTSTGRQVAIKVLLQGSGASAQISDRFYQEAIVTIALRHPNIVRTYQASSHEGVPFLAMEFIDGIDLSRLVKLRGPLQVGQAIDFALQAAHGLAYAHDQGIVHRDIKPQNLVIDKAGTLKVLDMGLAMVLLSKASDEETSVGRLTQYGQVMGTPTYMAPEQASDILFTDCRADIYSLGCTLHFMLTGAPPYQGESIARVLQAHQSAPIPAIQSEGGDISGELDAIFGRMVAKSPADRQQTMHEVIQDLSRVLRSYQPDRVKVEQERRKVDQSLSQDSIETEEHAREVLNATYGNESYEVRLNRFLGRVEQQAQPELAVDLALRLEHSGNQLRDMCIQVRAIEKYNKAIDIYDRIANWNCEFEFTQGLTRTLIQRGISWRQIGDHEAALCDFDRAAEILSQFVEQNGRREFDQQFAVALRERGHLYQRTGAAESAGDDFDKAVGILESAAEESESSKCELAVLYSTRAKLRYEQEDYERAAEDFTSVLNVIRNMNVNVETKPSPDFLAATLRRRGRVYILGRRFRDALDDYESAAGIYNRLVHEDGAEDLTVYLRECEQQCARAGKELGLPTKRHRSEDAQSDAARLTVTKPDPTDVDEHNVMHSMLVRETRASPASERIPSGLRQAMSQYRIGLDAFEQDHWDEAIAAFTTAIDVLTPMVEARGHRDLAEHIPRLVSQRAAAWAELKKHGQSLDDYDTAVNLFVQLVAHDKRSDLMRELKETVRSRDFMRKQVRQSRSPWDRALNLLGLPRRR